MFNSDRRSRIPILPASLELVKHPSCEGGGRRRRRVRYVRHHSPSVSSSRLGYGQPAAVSVASRFVHEPESYVSAIRSGLYAGHPCGTSEGNQVIARCVVNDTACLHQLTVQLIAKKLLPHLQLAYINSPCLSVLNSRLFYHI